MLTCNTTQTRYHVVPLPGPLALQGLLPTMLQLDWHLTQGPEALFRTTFGRAARALELIFDTLEIDEVSTFCRAAKFNLARSGLANLNARPIRSTTDCYPGSRICRDILDSSVNREGAPVLFLHVVLCWVYFCLISRFLFCMFFRGAIDRKKIAG